MKVSHQVIAPIESYRHSLQQISPPDLMRIVSCEWVRVQYLIIRNLFNSGREEADQQVSFQFVIIV